VKQLRGWRLSHIDVSAVFTAGHIVDEDDANYINAICLSMNWKFYIRKMRSPGLFCEIIM